VQKSVSGDQRGIRKGNLESLWDAGGCVQKSVSGDQRGIRKGNLESLWYAVGGEFKSQIQRQGAGEHFSKRVGVQVNKNMFSNLVTI